MRCLKVIEITFAANVSGDVGGVAKTTARQGRVVVVVEAA